MDVFEIAAQSFATPALRKVPETAGAMAVQLDPHNQVQRSHLELIDAALIAMRDRASDRVLIVMPPQTGKTSRAAVWGTFWWLAQHPRDRVLLVSYSADYARERGRDVRKLVQRFGSQFGLRLDSGTRSAGDWKITTGGGMVATGVGGSITGRPADVVIVDDPVKGREQADSPAYRESTWNTWSADIVPRLAPGAPALVIQTRWHEDDLAGRLLDTEGRTEDGGRWRVVHLAAVAQDADPESPIWRYEDPLGREPGEPLPHPQIKAGDKAALIAHWNDKRAGMMPRDWGALMQGDPRPQAGSLLDWKVMRERRVPAGELLPAARRVAVSLDPSGGGGDEAGIIGGLFAIDGRVYVTHDRSGHMGSADWGRAACLLAFEIGADCFIVEKNYGGDQARTILALSWARLADEDALTGLLPRVVEVTAKRGKVARAEPVAQAITEDRARFAGMFPELESQWATYLPGSSSPDRLDAHVYLVTQLLPPVRAPMSYRKPRLSSARALG